MWGGYTSQHGGELLSDVYTFDPYRRSWWTRGTTSSPQHPYLYDGACASDGPFLYLYGGYDGSNFQSSLYQLDSKKWQWSELSSGGGSGGPMTKRGCGMAAHADRLVLFGGYGHLPVSTQPGAEFIPDNRVSEDVGWTNEFHAFDLKKGKEMRSKEGNYRALEQLL